LRNTVLPVEECFVIRFFFATNLCDTSTKGRSLWLHPNPRVERRLLGEAEEEAEAEVVVVAVLALALALALALEPPPQPGDCRPARSKTLEARRGRLRWTSSC
jgi:hypothetical protein